MQNKYKNIQISGGNDRQTDKGCGLPKEKGVKSFLIEEKCGNFLIFSWFRVIPEAAQVILQ